MIAGVVFAQQNKMVTLTVKPVHLVKSRTLGDVYLTSDYAVYARFVAGFIEVDGTVHNAVIGHGD